jgi:hypothetical protein
MPGDYIPSTDSGLLAWSANFNAKLTAAPTTVGLTAGDATAYATLHSNYNTALTNATNPSTRTSSTITTKDTARVALVTKARDLVAIAQAYPGTTNTLRSDFGMTISDAVPSPIGAPSSKPVVNVERINNLAHVVRIRDEATPLSNARPVGSIGAEVYVAYGPTVPASIADYSYVGLATRVPYEVQHAAGDARKQAYYLTRWISPRGERGPVSDQTEATVAA